MIDTNKTVLDARCAIVLLILINIVAFTQKNKILEISMFSFLFLLMLVCGCARQFFNWFMITTIILVLQYIVLPEIELTIFSGLMVMLSVIRKIMPCLIIVTIVAKKIPSHYVILALRKMHVPTQVLIPLSVSVRYVPSIKIESSLAYDAMKLRCIGKIQRLECILTSLVMNAINITDELSIAAVTRGIENPCNKTTVFQMQFGILDWLSISVGIVLCICSIISMGVC